MLPMSSARSTPPTADTARRLEWRFLPPDLRARIEEQLGSPVVSAIGAWIWLGQSMTGWQCLGSAIVLASLGAIALNARTEAVRAATLSDPAQ